jgi:diaminopimelate decarboxylase
MITRRMALATADLYPADSSLSEGRLAIGGCDAIALADRFGTPAYVLAERDLRERARAAAGALAEHHDGPGRIVFASKALPCTAVLRIFAEEGLGVDVASAGELHLALKAGFEPGRIVVHGNAKSLAELRTAVEHRLVLAIDNLDEIDRLEGLAGGGPQPVLLRVVPEVQTDTHHAVATGHADQKFGLTLAEAAAAAERLRGAGWADLQGIHAHIGSQLFDLAPYREAVAALAGLGRFPVYDLGGGLAAAYTAEHRPPSVDEWVAGVVGAAHELLGAQEAELWIEPGRALVANAGVTLYTVENVKQRFVAVDGGMSDNLRPMLYGARYEAHAAHLPATGGSACKLVGKHCESGDVIVEDAHLPDPKVGDVIVTPATGGYGFAMANTYNGIPRAPVVFVSGGDARVVVRRETSEELYARDV